MKNPLIKPRGFIKKHKFISLIILIVILILGYFTYKKIFAAPASLQYIQATVKKGEIIKSVTGSGQVSSENQLDVASEVSGKIISISATVGQNVKAGDLIATIDSHDALLDLQNASIAYKKLVEPAKKGDVTNAQNSINKSYNDGLTALSDTFLHLPSIMSGLKDLFYGNNGYLGDSKATALLASGRAYRDSAAKNFDSVNNTYPILLQEYKNLDKNSSSSTVKDFLNRTYIFERGLSETLKETQAAVTYISTSQTDYYPTLVTATANSVSTWSTQIGSDSSSLLSAKNGIDSSTDTYDKLLQGAEALDIQSELLSLQQKERAYSKYFIRAPFAGIIGRIPVHTYDQVGSGTTIATVSSNQKITNIALNEVDAVQVKGQQQVTLTFDAISGLKINGVVTQVDLVGTASQGVVTYNVKIAFEDSDTRIRPGMSVDALIVTEEKKDIIVVVSSAIKTQGVGQRQTRYVEILDQNGIVQKKEVTIGDSDDTNTEITSGIAEGDKIIVRTVTGGTAGAKSTTPTIFSGLGGSQRNVIRNANVGR